MKLATVPFLHHLVDLEVYFAKSVPGKADALRCSWWTQQIDQTKEWEELVALPLICLIQARLLMMARALEQPFSVVPTLPHHL